jgi:type I restriction enzyme S subunit
MPEQLPTGWIKTTLGEIAQPSRTRVSPMDVPTARYVGLEHIESQSMKLIGNGFASEIRSSAVRFSKGDVLYGKMRPYLNKVWVAEFDGLCSAEFLVFQKHDGLNNQFLAFRLNEEDFVTFANGQASGERPRVDFEKLSHFRILLPPVAEQARMVSKLSAAFSKMDKADAAARRARKRLIRYSAAVLDAAVSGELTREWREVQIDKKSDGNAGEILLKQLLDARRTRWEEAELRRRNTGTKAPKDDKWRSRYREATPPRTEGLSEEPKGWAWISIDQLGWSSGYGTSTKCTYDGKGPAVLRIPNIRCRSVDFGDLKFAASLRDFKDEDFVAPGDLLLIRTNGSKELIGRTAIVKTPPSIKCSFASYLIRFRLLGDEVIWSWLSLAWESNIVRQGIESRAATTAGQYNVSLSGLADLAIPLPPSNEQAEIICEVERRLLAADRLAAALEQQLVRASNTRQSLLLEAFAGRLVNQNPNDEPASLLLEHIHSIREAEAQKSKGGAMSTPKVKTKSVGPRNLLTVLEENSTPMTPEELFHASGHSQESVDEFFAELRQLTTIPAKITEERKAGAITLLKAL